MKDSRDKLIIRFLCAKTNTKALNKGNKLYYLFLHEDLYPIILQNQSNFVLTKDTIKTSPKRSFLEMKRIIVLLRSNESFYKKRSSFDNLLKQKKKIICHLILESIAFFLLCTQEKKSPIERKHTSISVHKPLEYIENHWQYHSFGFHGNISRFFHPEIILRILRKKIKDISFLHLIRKFLHLYVFFSSSGDQMTLEKTLKDSSFKKVINILWNIYVLEIDNFFLLKYKDYYSSQKCKYTSINEWLSCLQKIKEWKSFLRKEQYRTIISTPIGPLQRSFLHPYGQWVPQKGETRAEKFFYLTKRKLSFLEKSRTYKYLRTNTLWFLFFQKKKTWNFLIKGRIMRFFSRRLGYVFQANNIALHLLARTSYFFLAYIFQFTNKKNIVRINTNFFLLMNFFIINYVSFINPLFLIINALARQNFCTSFGYPKSKSGWVTWTDSKIIEHFNRLRNTFFLFYSGCNNSKALYRIQYILHYSCAKTLACKHKTNLRKICKKFGSNLEFKGSLYSRNQIINSKLTHLYNNQRVIRLWNFQLKQMDSIIFLLEKLYK
jgi:hypothetical protein